LELVDAERSQKLFRQAGLTRVREDLESYVQQRTAEIRRSAGARRPPDSLLTAFHYTDAKHIYG
jgi:hypothetical protein